MPVKRNRHGFRNPLPGLFWALLFTCLAGAIAALAYAFNPGIAGHPLAGTASEAAYRFEQLVIERPYFSLQVTSGYIVPIVSGDEVRGAYVLGMGRYLFHPPDHEAELMEIDIGHRTLEDSCDAVFVPATYQVLEQLLYETAADELFDESLSQRAADLFAADRDAITAALPFAGSRLLTFQPVQLVLLLHGHRFGTVAYAEGSEISMRFVTLGGKEVSLNNPAAGRPTLLSTLNRPAMLPLSVALFVANLAILFALVYVLTLDLEHQPIGLRLHTRRRNLAALAIGLVFMDAAFQVVSSRLGFISGLPFGDYWLYGAFGLLIVSFLLRYRLGLGAVGISRIHFGRGLLLALFLGALTPVAMTLSYPTVFPTTAPLAIAARVGVSLLTVGFLQSLYLHGFLQTSLARLIGGLPSLLATAFTATCVHHIPLFMAWTADQGLARLQPVFVYPITILFGGYLYMRTGNLVSVMVLYTLLDVIPRLFQF